MSLRFVFLKTTTQLFDLLCRFIHRFFVTPLVMPLFFLVIITPLLYLVAILSVVFTARLSGYENLLRVMTQENGFFEILSVVLLFGIFFYGIASSL